MLTRLVAIALAAGQAILSAKAALAPARLKSDASPVTDADEKAEAIILDGLRHYFPEITIVAEERCAAGVIPDPGRAAFFLVDALDGTREFINGKDDYTVNIALIEDGLPTAGVVYAPERKVIYAASGGRAYRSLVGEDGETDGMQPIFARQAPQGGRVALTSRSHDCSETGFYLESAEIAESRAMGSSLKFCLIADGSADLYPRFTRTMQWDTAAGDAILRAAGGQTRETDGTSLRYGPRGAVDQERVAAFANPHFIATGRED